MRDWHATYLTDPTVMAAAAQRAAVTGEDGWAIAAQLAKTLPPAMGSHDAHGAVAVLAPARETRTETTWRELMSHAERNWTPPSGSAPVDPARIGRPSAPTYAAYEADTSRPRHQEAQPTRPRMGCDCTICRQERHRDRVVFEAQVNLAEVAGGMYPLLVGNPDFYAWIRSTLRVPPRSGLDC